jgi:hypothetical protein
VDFGRGVYTGIRRWTSRECYRCSLDSVFFFVISGIVDLRIAIIKLGLSFSI